MKTLTIALLFAFVSASVIGQSVYVHGGLGDMGLDSATVKEELNYTCDPKPPPKPPAQHSSAEGLPPLPLPVVPLRRTEKKNPPTSPVLVVKIKTERESDWATNPQDIENLLKWMAKNLGVHFSSQNKTVEEVFGTAKAPDKKWAKKDVDAKGD